MTTTPTTGRPVVDTFDWGELTWFAGSSAGHGASLTLGQCRIRPGQENPRHAHPNCAEVLTLTAGTIVHTLGDDELEMRAGDTIEIPAGIPHNARNVGDDDALMTIAYPTANREFVPE